MDIGAPELIIILVILLVLFGGKKIPDMARNLGRAQREFRDAMRDGDEADAATDEPPAVAAAAPRSDEAAPPAQ